MIWKMYFLVISCVTALMTTVTVSEDERGARLNVFHKIADRGSSGNNKTLSVVGLQEFVDNLVKNLDCEDHDDGKSYSHDHGNDGDDHNDEEDHHSEDECSKFMCVNVTALLTHALGLHPSDSISDKQFEDVCVILLHLITSAEGMDRCHKVVDEFSSMTLESSKRNLLNMTLEVGDGAAFIPPIGLSKLLDILKRHIVHDHHDHGDDDHDHDHDDHDHNGHDHDDHDHDHDDHDHDDQGHSDHGHDDHDHAKDHGDHDHDHDDHDHANHTSHDDHDHDHANHTSHDDHDHDHANHTSHDDHDHANVHGDHDHDHANHTSHDDHDHDHDHANHTSHDDHDHANQTSHDDHDHANDHGDHDHDHDHANDTAMDHDDHHDSHEEGHEHEHSDEENQRSDDEDHEGHEHDHEEEEAYLEQAAALVLRAKCLSEDAIKYYMGINEKENIPVSKLSQLSTFVAFMVFDGYDVQDKCRQLPYTGQFPGAIFNRFGNQEGQLDEAGLDSLMMNMGISQETKVDSHDHDDHHDHSHDRKRRSARREEHKEFQSFSAPFRSRRQAPVANELTTCYSAAQLMALYDSAAGVDQASFQQMCPALVSQKLFADCVSPAVDVVKDDDKNVSDREKYGYGTIAIAIICACAILGVIFVPCASARAYSALMTTFIGLAVGTLFADAVLHLIPSAMGIHAHDHDHDHGSDDYVVEEYVQFGLAIMGGLYVFYVLESFMSKLGGHSHSQESESEEFSNMDAFPNGLGAVDERGNGVKERYIQHETNLDASTDKKLDHFPSQDVEKTMNAEGGKKKTFTPLVLMVLLGDAVHNFADGLAVGAAFSSSISTGVATSIAVFCHELPHELGDFAVLLQSGCSFKKAIFLNFVSALTAFAGLYVGILVATTTTAQNWIFAVAAGMFIYIALVDLLPQLIRSKSTFHIILNNIGILIGYGIMLLIAVFEEHIEV